MRRTGRVNLILFEPTEIATPLPRRDPRAVHVIEVLRRQIGDTFDVGLIDGPRGKATLLGLGADALTLGFAWGPPPAPLDPVTLIVGLPRPQTARDILRDATTLGVTALHFVRTEKGAPGYAQSTLWSSGEWRRRAIAGAEQAFETRLPAVSWERSVAEQLAALPLGGTQLALDNYEPGSALGSITLAAGTLTLAFGPERGWSAAEREMLRASGFVFVDLGARVLRLETAIVAALAIVRAKRGAM